MAPAGVSLIADSFAPNKRGRALGVLASSSGIGAGLSFLIGSATLGAIPEGESVIIPFLGEFVGWQFAFIASGAPGIVIALLLFTVREPERRELASASGTDSQILPLIRTHIGGHALAFIAVVGSGAFLALMAYAVNAWTAAYFIRHFEMPISQVGLMVGLSVMISGVIQGPLSGVIGDALATRFEGGRIWILPLSIVAALPFAFAWPFATSPYTALAILVASNICGAIALHAVPALLQELTPNELRGLVSGANSAALSVVGAGLGPTAVALMSDNVFQDDKLLGAAIASVSLPAYILALLLSMAGVKSYARARLATLSMTSSPSFQYNRTSKNYN